METTYVNPSPYIWLGVLMFFIFMLHVATSAWLYSFRLFLSTIITGCLFIVLTFGLGNSEIKDFFLSIYISLFIVYAIGLKYVTNTRFFDLSKQSHEKLKESIFSKEESTLFDQFLLKLGPFLFITIWLYAFYVLAVKYLL